jgi:hypothetical protein
MVIAARLSRFVAFREPHVGLRHGKTEASAEETYVVPILGEGAIALVVHQQQLRGQARDLGAADASQSESNSGVRSVAAVWPCANLAGVPTFVEDDGVNVYLAAVRRFEHKPRWTLVQRQAEAFHLDHSY